MSIYGYCRVSTISQTTARQVNNIKAQYPECVIIEEKYTGTTMERKEWKKLYSKVKSGDTIVFDSVSRMSRNAEQAVSAYEELYNRGVELVFLKEPYCDTRVYRKALEENIPMTNSNVDYILEGVNKYLIAVAKEQIRLAFIHCEQEAMETRQRVKEGLTVAKMNGSQIGQKPGAKLTTKKSIAMKEIIQKHSKDFGGSLNDVDCMRLCGIARNSYYKYKKELKQELEELN